MYWRRVHVALELQAFHSEQASGHHTLRLQELFGLGGELVKDVQHVSGHFPLGPWCPGNLSTQE